jgi:hypothetical protein
MSDQLFTTHKFEIEFDKFGQEIGIFPHSDIHYGAYNHDGDKWEKALAKCRELSNTMPIYYLGGGDYIDLASTSERKIFGDDKIHDTSRHSIDGLANRITEEYIEQTAFMKGKMIGMVEGNHHFRYESGQTNTMQICRAMGCKYLGGVSIIRLIFSYAKGNKKVSTDIYSHHTAGSKGGGRREGASLNNLENMMHVVDADIYLAGHDHKFNLALPSTIYLDHQMNIKERERMLVRTGSFQKGWMPDHAGYVPTFNGRPNYLGCPLIILKPTLIKVKQSDGKYAETLIVKKSVRVGDWF